MPPAIEASDDESVVEAIPHHITKKNIKGEGAAESNDEAEDGSEDEEVYVVETIRDHQIIDGVLKYEVKWMGYNRKEDNTWEPEENLTSAPEILEEYIKSIGGKPAVPERGGKKRGRHSEGNGNTPDTTKKPAKKGRLSQSATKASSPADTPSGDKPSSWKPPKGSWEGQVQMVDTIEQADDGGLHVYLMWNDGKKSKHPIKVCYEKCPQTMLRFYENHLVFTSKERPSNGE